MCDSVKGKTFFLDQHGCAKNQVDGELLISRLQNLGLKRTDEAENADLIIVNSCGFINSAKEESLNAVFEARESFPKAKILLAGCLAERYAETFKNELPEADGIFGNGDLSYIDNVVLSLFKNERPIVTPPQKGVCGGDRDFLLSFKGSVYVKITEGCNNRCSFCAIPIIRGSLRSRTIQEITDEIESLVASGTKEINLIGQDLASYGMGSGDDVLENGGKMDGKKSFLLSLMERISCIKGDFWVRLLYIHPDHFKTDILPFMQKDPRFLPYFDIPFQSASDRLLTQMNRHGSFDAYASLVKSIRDVFSQACLRTTFIAGFPGETEADAERTAEFLKTIQSDWSGCFVYSNEEDTPASAMENQVEEKCARERAQKLEALQAEITREKLNTRRGKIYDVLIEEIIDNPDRYNGSDEGLAIGRAWFQAPEVDGNVVIRYDLSNEKEVSAMVVGNFVKVNCFASTDLDLDGELVL